jgi:hypothetical protein
VLFLLIVAIPATGCANVPLPTVFAFLPQAMLGTGVFLASLVGAVVIEAAVLHLLFKQPVARSLSLAARANAYSTIFGFGFILHPLEFLVLIALLITVGRLAKSRFHLSPVKAQLLAIGCGVLLVSVLVPWSSFPAAILQFYLVMVVSFGLSVLLESFVLVQSSGRVASALRWSLAANGASYACLLAVFLVLHFNTGAFAIREWYVYNIVRRGEHQRPHEETLQMLREFHDWERTRGRIRVTNSGWKESSIFELLLVEQWAKDNDVVNARELMELVRQNSSGQEPESIQQGAETALREAEGRRSSATQR